MGYFSVVCMSRSFVVVILWYKVWDVNFKIGDFLWYILLSIFFLWGRIIYMGLLIYLRKFSYIVNNY